METVICIPGDGNRLAGIVGGRKNLHHTGSTGGTSIQECLKSSLKEVPVVATMEKHDMLGSARVLDESRALPGAKGVLIANVSMTTATIFDFTAVFTMFWKALQIQVVGFQFSIANANDS